MPYVVAVGLLLLAGVCAAPVFGPVSTLPCVVAGAALILVIPRRGDAAMLSGVAGAVSLLATAAALVWPPQNPAGSFWGFAESLALIVLTGVLARWAPARQGLLAGGVAALGASVWLFRYFVPPSLLEGLGIVAFWSLGTAVAAGVGLYLRSLDSGKARALADDRLRMARDLHDFVAHDVSEMIAQAQAGLVVGAQDPARVLAVLTRIEQAGQRAMAAMDRTVRMLNEPVPDLHALVSRFSASGGATAQLTVEGEVSALAYRIVVEALTNVRRHAPSATRVQITVDRSRVTVVNDGVRAFSESLRGGFGLRALTEQVEALGGNLHAAADGSEWRLEVELP